MAQGGLLDKILTSSSNYLGVGTIYPEIQTLLELNTNIKMVGAQLGVASKQSAGFNTQISRLSYTSGLASDSLMKVVSSAAKYNKAIGTDMLSSAVRFSDATGVDTQKLGEFTSKMLSLGSISTKTYNDMLVKILQTRESYGLSTEATYGLMEATENYYITLGKTGDEIVKASGKMAEFISRMNSAGIETETATDILDKMINPDKMEDNIMLMNRLGISISDMVVGEPLKNLEDVAPRLKALAQEITSQPNRMLANEMAKMYGYTLAEMQKMTKIETDQKVIAEQKTLQEYRTQIQTAQTGLKDVMTQAVGGFALGINNVAQELNKVLGPKALGATLGVAVLIGLKAIQGRLGKASLSFKKNIKDGIEEGADSFYKKLSGIGAGEERGSFNKLRKVSRVSPDEPEYTESSIVDSFGLKTKIRNPFVASDKIIDNYNKIVGEGAYHSQKRVDKYSKDYNKYKNSPKEASDFFKAREKIVKESLGAETSWLMKKSMSQQENKMAKAPKIRKDDSMGGAKAKVEGQLGETYEGLLKRSTQLQEVENEISRLEKIGDGVRTDAEDRLLIKLEASGKTLSGSVEETIAKLKGTSIGSKFIKKMIAENESDIAIYTEQTKNMTIKITEAKALLEEEGSIMDGNQKLIMQSNIKSMEEDLKKVGELVLKTSEMNKNLKEKGEQARETANIIGEETTINIKKQGETIKQINKDLIKQNKVAAMNIGYGLEATAGVGARNLARGKTLANSALSGLTGIAKSIGIPLGVGSAVTMGVGLLVKSAKKSEAFQKASSELAEASAPILDLISTTLGKTIAIPMKFVASAVSKISKAPMFDKKDDVDLEILDDMRNSYKVEQQEVVAWLKYIGETSKESTGYNQKAAKNLEEQNANQWVLATATRT